MKNKPIEQILDKSSYGIYEYSKQLNSQINQTYSLSGYLKNFNEPLKKNSIKIFHYSNSTRRILFSLIKSPNKDNIVIIHDILPRNKILKKFNWILIKIIKNNCEEIIVHSNFAKNLLLKNYKFMAKKNIKIVPHGTFIHYKNPKKIKKIKTVYKINRDKKIILLLGAINKNRGQINLIEELNKINDNNLLFLIAGKCKDNKFLSKIRKNKKIRYLGFVNDKELEDLFEISDATLIYREYSVGESSGAITYSIGHCTPIIASNVGSFKESIYNAGIIFENNQVKKIREFISEFIKNEKKLKNNAKILAKKISWENCLWRIIN